MGFKRTSEGRVFFKKTDQDNNVMEEAQEKENGFIPRALAGVEAPTKPVKAEDSSVQIQILELLRALNKKLQDGQAERAQVRQQLDVYKMALAELETKTSDAEKDVAKLSEKLSQPNDGKALVQSQKTDLILQETLRELEETRRYLTQVEDKTDKTAASIHGLQRANQDYEARLNKNSIGYGELVKRLKQSEAQQLVLSEKVNTALEDQVKLALRIEEVNEERERFMRKIERIEETVLQTRDALNAKAGLLIADQKDVKSEKIEWNEELTLAQAIEQHMRDESSYREQVSEPSTAVAHETKPGFSRVGFQVAIVAFVLAGGVFAGWMFNQNRITDEGADLTTYSNEDLAALALKARQSRDSFVPPSSESLVEAPSQPSMNESQRLDQRLQEITKAQKPGALEQFARDRQLEEAPAQGVPASRMDEIAAQMNDIEPGNPEQSIEPMPVVSLEETSEPPEPEIAAAPVQVREPAAQPAPEPVAALEPEPVAQAPITRAPTPPAQAPVPVARTEESQGATQALSSHNFGELGPDSSLPEMIKRVEEQAYDGSPEAQHDLAAIYTAGHGGVSQDFERAAYWFTKAAGQGVANAQYNLGVLYHQGLGVDADIKTAIKWYESAAALGHPEAQYNLGIAFIEGIGVRYDPQRAARYFEQAARSGIMEAAYNLGLIYENALLGQAQPDLALKWYKQAADQGSPEAKAALGQLAKTLDIRLEDVNRLVESMSDTAALQSPQAEMSNEAAVEAREIQMVEQIQDYLTIAGIYPGPSDGRYGPLTGDAIRAYQNAYSLRADGLPSPDLLSHMRANPSLNEVGSR